MEWGGVGKRQATDVRAEGLEKPGKGFGDGCICGKSSVCYLGKEFGVKNNCCEQYGCDYLANC